MTAIEAKCESCGEVYSAGQLTEIVHKERTKTKWRPWGSKETAYTYPKQKLRHCPECGHGVFHLVIRA